MKSECFLYFGVFLHKSILEQNLLKTITKYTIFSYSLKLNLKEMWTVLPLNILSKFTSWKEILQFQCSYRTYNFGTKDLPSNIN